MEGIGDVVVCAHLCVTSLLLLYINTGFGFVLRCWQHKLLLDNRNQHLSVILNLRERGKRKYSRGRKMKV